jgi:DNA-binding transcriptional ArsR family regulator
VTVDAWVALADPTRRTILARVAERPLSVGQLADHLPTMTRPNVSQHLRVLREAGLVTVESEGTKRIYSARPEALQTLRTELDGFWNQALANFRRRIDERKQNPDNEGDSDDGDDR